jgi:hypothetical protein
MKRRERESDDDGEERDRARERERARKSEMYILVDIIHMHAMVFAVQMHTIHNWRPLAIGRTTAKPLSHL